MSPKKHKKQQQAFHFPTARELYDLWMSAIEPELTSHNIDHADELHADETPEERAERYAWYADAFRIFDEHRATVNLAMMTELKRMKRDKEKVAERKESSKEQKALDAIDRTIQSMP